MNSPQVKEFLGDDAVEFDEADFPPDLGFSELYLLSAYAEIDKLRKKKITHSNTGEIFTEFESIGVREIEFYLSLYPDEVDDPGYFTKVMLKIDELKISNGLR